MLVLLGYRVLTKKNSGSDVLMVLASYHYREWIGWSL